MVKVVRKLKRWLGYRLHGSKNAWLRHFDAASPRATEQVFTHIYANNIWGDTESVSGAGSSLEVTKVLREKLPGLLKDLQIRTVLDIPCGDYYWLSQTKLEVESYLGADIVVPLIEANQTRYRNVTPGRSVAFRQMNLMTDTLPRHDLILCRDCLVHFSNDDVCRALHQIKRSGSTYLLTTNYPPPRVNDREIRTGEWRPLNLQSPPFNLPKPLLTILEGFTGRKGRFSDKTLALWKIADLA